MHNPESSTWPPILLLTDFGYRGPYVGQLHSAIARVHGDLRVIDLMHDLPEFSAGRSAILLQAAAPWFPERCVICAVVDPGVGSARRAIALRKDQRWFVGPDNGLLMLVAPEPDEAIELEVPAWASASFHGRDLFAPSAAQLAMGRRVGQPLTGEIQSSNVQRHEIVYIDRYGNAMTGLRSESVGGSAVLIVGGTTVKRARTFSDVDKGQAFFYENSWGLIEVAINQGSASAILGLSPGTPIQIVDKK